MRLILPNTDPNPYCYQAELREMFEDGTLYASTYVWCEETYPNPTPTPTPTPTPNSEP